MTLYRLDSKCHPESPIEAQPQLIPLRVCVCREIFISCVLTNTEAYQTLLLLYRDWPHVSSSYYMTTWRSRIAAVFRHDELHVHMAH